MPGFSQIRNHGIHAGEIRHCARCEPALGEVDESLGRCEAFDMLQRNYTVVGLAQQILDPAEYFCVSFDP